MEKIINSFPEPCKNTDLIDPIYGDPCMWEFGTCLMCHGVSEFNWASMSHELYGSYWIKDEVQKQTDNMVDAINQWALSKLKDRIRKDKI